MCVAILACDILTVLLALLATLLQHIWDIYIIFLYVGILFIHIFYLEKLRLKFFINSWKQYLTLSFLKITTRGPNHL